MGTGLRERKKLQTRQAISDIATRLFLERGFEAVTIAQVAEAADVSKMTVTNYFPRKEDLVFDRAGGIVTSLAEAVTGRAPGESMLAAVRRDYAERLARLDPTLGLASAGFTRLVAGSPVLTARGRELEQQRERALGDAIAAETGDSGVTPWLVAALLAAVYRVLYAEASAHVLAGQPPAAIATALADVADRAFGLLEPSLGGYGAIR
jgi:AcrR family transcriptional regulator